MDESGFSHRCSAQYGYAPRGVPAIVQYTPVSDRRRLSLIMAVHQAGSSHHHVSELPTNGAAFATFVDDLPFAPGTTLLLDNASIHKTKSVRAAAACRGYTLLFLPPYSPELNPIELVFGVAKQHFYRSRYTTHGAWCLDTAVADSIQHAARVQTVRGCFRHVTRCV